MIDYYSSMVSSNNFLAPALVSGLKPKSTSTATKPTSLSSALEEFERIYGNALNAVGYEEAKEEQRALLERALGILQPFLSSSFTGQSQRFTEQQSALLDAIAGGVQQLMSPESPLAGMQRAQVDTNTREQLRMLKQNAAIAGLPQSQEGMLDVLQERGREKAQIPAQNMLAGIGAAAQGAQAAALGQEGIFRAFQTQYLPAAQMADILSGTQVTTPLLEPTLSGIIGAGTLYGNFFPRMPGYPWSYLNA